MKFAYYPGCTLATKAREFDKSVRNVAKFLGIELEELQTWTCCGVCVPLVQENLMGLIAPVRNLAYAKEGNLVTVCNFCYNVLKHASKTVMDKEKLEKINNFIQDEYKGNVKVMHLLEVIKGFGFENLAKKVKKDLAGLKVAPFYGCLLLRPAEIALDDPERPRILEKVLQSAGCKVVEFPYKTECCGSYLSVSSPATARECSYAILNSALKNGADLLVVSCPLCHFNLDKRQKEMIKKYKNFKKIPVLYFTQILEIALGNTPNFSSNFADPLPLLRRKKLC
jgi:heterodisulfide reductase subunit B